MCVCVCACECVYVCFFWIAVFVKSFNFFPVFLSFIGKVSLRIVVQKIGLKSETVENLTIVNTHAGRRTDKPAIIERWRSIFPGHSLDQSCSRNRGRKEWKKSRERSQMLLTADQPHLLYFFFITHPICQIYFAPVRHQKTQSLTSARLCPLSLIRQ